MDLYSKYHHLVEQSTQTGVWEYDYTSSKMTWSDYIFTIFDCDKNHSPTTEANSGFFTASSISKLTRSIALLEEFQHGFSGVFEIHDTKGKLKTIALSMEAEFSERKIYRRYGTIRDITQQHKQTIESEFFRERVELALKASATGTWDYHVAEDKLYWDDSMQDIFGLAPYSTIEKFSHWLDLIHPEDRNEFIEQFNTGAKGLAEYNTILMTCRTISPLGRVAFVRINARFYIDESNRNIRVLGTCVDATEAELARRDIIEQATISQENMLKAQDITAARTRFLANMSHEIRTPMNAVMGALQILQTYDLDEDSLSLTDIALDSSKDLLSIINDILDLSKIDAEQMKIEHIPIQVDELVTLTFNKFVISHSNNDNVKLALNISPNFNPHRTGDSLRIKQILNNLLSNAIKFTHQGSVTVYLSGNEHSIELVVKDTGVGIPKDKLLTIFERFKQADESTTRSFGGTGLGLAICSSLTTLMNGTIEVFSEEGVGTEFTFCAPIPTSIKLVASNQ